MTVIIVNNIVKNQIPIRDLIFSFDKELSSLTSREKRQALSLPLSPYGDV